MKLTKNQYLTLVDYARSAFGSGRNEGKNGGRGFMGVYKDAQGRFHTIKFLTHFGEGGCGAIEKLDKAKQDQIDQMSQALRESLFNIAKSCGNATVLKNVCEHLNLDLEGKVTAKTPRLIERTIVAKVISEFVPDEDALDPWYAVDSHHRAQTVDNTKLNAVLESLDKVEQGNQFGLRVDYKLNELGSKTSWTYQYKHPYNGIMMDYNVICREMKSVCKGKPVQCAIAYAINQFSLRAHSLREADEDDKNAYLAFLDEANGLINGMRYKGASSVANLLTDLKRAFSGQHGMWNDLDTFMRGISNACREGFDEYGEYVEII